MKRKLEEARDISENINKSVDEINNDGADIRDQSIESIQENVNVINDIGGPSSKKKRKKTSPVWNHFTVRVSDVDNKSEFAHCHYCDK